MPILFSNATVLPMTASGGEPRTFTGWVGTDGDRIALATASEADAAAFRAAHPGLREIDCRGKLVMPGLVNTHCHAAMTLQRSYADDISLMAWLHDYIWPFEAHQTPDDVKLGMTLGIVEMLLGGVTSFVDMYYFEDRCVEVAERLGIRALLGCNYFDTNADEVLPRDKTFTREACDAYVAEAKWVRALCYFYLVRTFRDVPYVTEPYLNDNQEFRVPKSDGMEVLKWLVADLRGCARDIPVAYEPGSWQNKGRATVWALYALLADMYLWLEDYDEAIAMCENIERSGLYVLLPAEEWYQLYYPGNSSESIMELQWDGAQLQTNSLFAWFYNESNTNNYAISDTAIAKFNEIPGEVDQRGDGGSYIAASSKVWKYAGTAPGGENLRESAQRDAHWIFYRLADVLLMKAEAYVMRGTPEDMALAYELVVRIRERAGYLQHPAMPENQSEAIDLVLDERLRELCFEGKRWFDLVRVAVRNQGEYKSKLVSLLLQNVAAKDRPLYEAKLQNTYGYYLPINEHDLSASGGVLVQNPYYL